MEVFLIRLLQFILAISLLVLLHEGGHFFFSKLFKVRVEKFYLFFDPWFHLFEWKPKNSDTAYGVGWLPLGGYCKISGMIDESFDTEQMKQPEQPWEFRSKPAWQRLLIMIGGVLVNFLLALFIYSMVLYTWGEDSIPMEKMSYGMKFNDDAKQLGFQDGDILTGTDRGTFDGFNAAKIYRDLSKAKEATVIRNGKQTTISLPGKMNMLNMLQTVPPFVSPYIPSEVDTVLPNTPAARIRMQKKARIVAINGKRIQSWNEYNNERGRLEDMLTAAETSSDSLNIRRVTITYRQRPDDDYLLQANVLLTPDLMLGVGQSSLLSYYQPVHRSYSLLQSIPAGIRFGWQQLTGYVGDMKYVFTKDGAKSLGGFGTIGSMFPPVWDWHTFWLMTAFLSIILAFMNILPIPALDGGHVLFLIYEIIARRKPSEKFLVRAEYVGFSLLIILLIVANLNDVLRMLHLM